MTVKKDSTTTSTSSSGASSAPPPQGHGIRAQIGSLIPKHALFQVHVHIDQLSNVPLIHGQFAVRWKFKNAQSGSGLLSKMKARRAFSGKGRGKALDDESGEEEEEDDSMHDDASRPVSPLSTRGHDDYGLDHPPRGPTPVVGMQRTSSQGNSESRGATRWAPLQSYNVKWDHSVSVVVQMDVHRETSDLLPNELKLVVMQRVIHGDPDSPQQPRLGAVHLNLAEYADAGQVTRRYLLRQSKTNATLKVTIELEHIGGEKHYKPPALRKGEILASVSSILSNNGLFQTRIARELDLYVGAEGQDEDGKPAFPYADQDGHLAAELLPTSFGLRTTEHMIEALFNPVPSASPEPSPFTYYTPPSQVQAQLQNPTLSSSGESFEQVDGRRRSVDSSSYAPSTSEHSGSAADHSNTMDVSGILPGATIEQRHWWRRMRSRPSTPASRGFKPPPVSTAVAVRNG